MAAEYETKGTEEQDSWDTGMRRGSSKGKGRPDLISPIALRRLADIYERGAEHYEDRNWEKGCPIGRFLESAMRHLNQYREGYRDEDHLGQATWNLFAALHAEEAILTQQTWPKELYDQRCYISPEQMDEKTFTWWQKAGEVLKLPATFYSPDVETTPSVSETSARFTGAAHPVNSANARQVQYTDILASMRADGAPAELLRVASRYSSFEAISSELQAARIGYWYAHTVVNGRWFEGEAVIVKSVYYAYLYALDVIRGRWLEAEALIVKDARYAYLYARYVIRGRWPEAEAGISADSVYSNNYLRHIIRGILPEAEDSLDPIRGLTGLVTSARGKYMARGGVDLDPLVLTLLECFPYGEDTTHELTPTEWYTMLARKATEKDKSIVRRGTWPGSVSAFSRHLNSLSEELRSVYGIAVEQLRGSERVIRIERRSQHEAPGLCAEAGQHCAVE